MSVRQNPKLNQLLASLPAEDWLRWQPELEAVKMPAGQVIYESSRSVYFPTTAIVSLLYVMESGASTEIAVVGNEGVVGISLYMAGNSTPNRAIVQNAGEGYRLSAQAMKTEFDRSDSVFHLLLRYTQALINQMVQTSICTRHHSLDQQLCRWLLLSMDRLLGKDLIVPLELVASMLGAPHESVFGAARRLDQKGLIRCDSKQITVRSRSGLEEHTCECYTAVTSEYDRLLPRQNALTAPMHIRSA